MRRVNFSRAIRRARSMPLSAYFAQGRYAGNRHYGGVIPCPDGDFSFTADMVVDDPREPRITPTGVLDHRGDMLVRVVIPIKAEMGFTRYGNTEPDEVEAIVPESLLSVSDIGVGIGHVDLSEVMDEEGEEA